MIEPINQRDSEGLPHGVWGNYMSGGTLQWRGRFLHGVSTGLWKLCWENGTTLRKEYYLTIK